MKVKALLVQPAAKFTEWLIQQGLVPPEQYDTNTKKKLKLGMYSDSKKFPHSGGYVWIAEGNQKQFTSVFKGSIFEITSHSPTVILKLMYHWSCQTNINVRVYVLLATFQFIILSFSTISLVRKFIQVWETHGFMHTTLT
jgi:hypothetical protein